MTLANGDVAIAICDRCKFKYAYKELSADRDRPGLRVCQDCNDIRDPWKEPGPPADPMAMRYPRPDVPLTDNREYVVTGDGSYIDADDGEDAGDLSP